MNRLESLRRNMVSSGIGAFFVTDINDIYYITGFTGSTAYLFVTQDSAVFLTDGRYAEQVKTEVSCDFEVVIVASYYDRIKTAATRHNVLWVTEKCPLKLYKMLEDEGLKIIVDDAGVIDKMRMIKDGDEVKAIKNAFKIAGRAFEESLEFFRTGITEIEWAAKLEYNMKMFGATEPSFVTIIASGFRGALPHGTASSKIVEKGDVVVVDYGAKAGYCSDITRTVCCGKNEKADKIIDIVYTALSKAKEAVRPGVKCCHIDKIARDYIAAKGYEKYFNHGLGHGVGIDVHELPAFNSRDETVLEEGMVLTIEPGIYLPGEFGVRLEDTILVNENSCENLTDVLDRYSYII